MGDGHDLAATSTEHVGDALRRIFRAQGYRDIGALERLTGGASQECWAFEVQDASGAAPMILRRAPARAERSPLAAGLDNEARVITRALEHGVPVPEVVHVLAPDDGLGEGFVMRRVAGEALPQRILRDARFAATRNSFVRSCGTVLAAIHAVDVSDLPGLRRAGAREQLRIIEGRLRASGQRRPVFELVLRWLGDRVPVAAGPLRLVHGDFRLGNIIVDEAGLRSVLDWELLHLGDPVEDLAWVCLPPWRFGRNDRPAAGLGDRSELIEAYEAASGYRVAADHLRFWEILGTLSWGIHCAASAQAFDLGQDAGIERALIARRTTETELDLLLYLREGQG